MSSKTTDVVMVLRDIESKMKQIMKRCFEDNGITRPQGMVVGTLHKQGEMKISELSRMLGLTNSTISGIVDRLEKQNIVERTRSQEDKRIVFVKLTPQFAEMHQNLSKVVEEKLEEVLSLGTEEEIAKVTEGLIALKNIVDKAVPSNKGKKNETK